MYTDYESQFKITFPYSSFRNYTEGEYQFYDRIVKYHQFMLPFNLVSTPSLVALKGLAHAKIIKKAVILFRVFNMTI